MARCRQYHVSADKLGAECERLAAERDELEKRVKDLESGSELMSVVMDTWVRDLTGRSLSGAASASEKAVLIDTGFKRWSNSLDSLKANNDALRVKNEELESERAQLYAIVDACAPVLHERVLGWGPMDPNEPLSEKQRIVEDGLIDIEDMVRAAEEATQTRRDLEALEEEHATLKEEKRTLETERLELGTRCSTAEAERAQMARIANGCVGAFNDKVLDRPELTGDETIQEKEDILRDGFAAIGQTRRELQEAQAEASATKAENAALAALLDACTVALGVQPTAGATLQEREAAVREGLKALDGMRARERPEGPAAAPHDEDSSTAMAMMDVYVQSMQDLILGRGALTGAETLQEKGTILMDGLAAAVDYKSEAERLERERDDALRRAEELERRMTRLQMSASEPPRQEGEASGGS